MLDRLYLIEEDEFKQFIAIATDQLITFIYAISKYHEKFRVTQWCKEELDKRHFDTKVLEKFDRGFSEFYRLMLTQNDL